MKRIMTAAAAAALVLLLYSPAYAEETEPPSATPPQEEPVSSEAPADEAVEAEQDEPAEVPEEETAAEAESEPAEENEKTGSIFDLLKDGGLNYEVDLTEYYLTEMTDAAVAGDTAAGRAAEDKRNSIIDSNGSGQEKIAFDDLYLLAKVICFEAGSDWLSNDFRMCVGEVIMNRVASPEYPDSIYDVIYQKGQYGCVNKAKFASMVPTADCVDVALRLLKGERLMVPAVVFQSNQIQGELFTMYTDRRLGNTYFCLSENMDMYPLN